jgi:hypothetical protein
MLTSVMFHSATCDTCGFTSRDFSSRTGLDNYLRDTKRDGKWLILRGRRTICRGCIIDRACRIFGHVRIEMPISAAHPYRREVWCNRCSNPVEASR